MSWKLPGCYTFLVKRVSPNDLKPLLGDNPLKKDITEELDKFGSDFITLRDAKEVVRHILTTINRITGAERGGIFLKKK